MTPQVKQLDDCYDTAPPTPTANNNAEISPSLIHTVAVEFAPQQRWKFEVPEGYDAKEWIWQHHSDQFFRALSIVELATTTTRHNEEEKSPEHDDDDNKAGTSEITTLKTDASSSSSSLFEAEQRQQERLALLSSTHDYSALHTSAFSDDHTNIDDDDCDGDEQEDATDQYASFQEDEDEMEEESHILNRKRLEILDKVEIVKNHFLQSQGPKVVYSCLVNGLLEIMQSEFGFIGEAQYDKDGSMYLQTHATTSVAWDNATVEYFSTHPGVTFFNMDTLMGRVLTTKEPVICNDIEFLKQLPLPAGHPGITSFLGIPLFEGTGRVIGNICIANKRGKTSRYTRRDVELLSPFSSTGSNLIQAYWQVEKNNQLIDTLEEKVRERTSKLERANSDLEIANQKVIQSALLQLQHFACMSHEIRTPLNCIIGLSTLLVESDMTLAQKDSMQMIVNSGELLLTVVNDVLDYSKLETGNVDVMVRNSSLQEVLNSTVHAIEAKAKSKNLKIRTVYGATVPEFFDTDSQRLQQILYNTMGNAIKFSKEGGVVELHVNRIFRHDTGEERPHLQFIVKDFGQGIDASEFGNIFEPFRQASAETERVYGGTGLGLAISRKLAQRLNGTITVDSVLGEWTAFTMEFPLLTTNHDSHTLPKDVVVYAVDREPTHLRRILNYWQVPCHIFPSMQALQEHVVSKDAAAIGCRCISLVDEDLYEAQAFRVVQEKLGSALTTFGPKFSVKESASHHRSLSKVLPSVLMRSLIEGIPTRRTPCEKHRASAKPTGTNHHNHNSNPTNKVPLRDVRVLIAEDNLVNQKVLAKMLQRLGTQDVEVVDNGAKAVQRAAERTFDVILMDMQMPVMDGPEACRRIVRNNAGAGPKVVFVTAHALGDHEVECRDAGGFGFITKPFTLNDIAKVLEQIAAL